MPDDYTPLTSYTDERGEPYDGNPAVEAVAARVDHRHGFRKDPLASQRAVVDGQGDDPNHFAQIQQAIDAQFQFIKVEPHPIGLTYDSFTVLSTDATLSIIGEGTATVESCTLSKPYFQLESLIFAGVVTSDAQNQDLNNLVFDEVSVQTGVFFTNLSGKCVVQNSRFVNGLGSYVVADATLGNLLNRVADCTFSNGGGLGGGEGLIRGDAIDCSGLAFEGCNPGTASIGSYHISIGSGRVSSILINKSVGTTNGIRLGGLASGLDNVTFLGMDFSGATGVLTSGTTTIEINGLVFHECISDATTKWVDTVGAAFLTGFAADAVTAGSSVRAAYIVNSDLQGIIVLGNVKSFGNRGFPDTPILHDFLDGGTSHIGTAVALPVKGSMIAGTGTVWDDLLVGTDGQFLTADSTVATLGLKWAPPPPPHTIQDEGVSLAQRTNLNFSGEYLSALDQIAADTTLVKSGYGTVDAIVDMDNTDYYHSRMSGSTSTTGTTGTVIQDTSKAYAVNELAGLSLQFRNSPASGQVRTISSNTATAITVSSAFSPVPTAAGGDTYVFTGADSEIGDIRARWPVNKWAGQRVRPLSGTASGQVRTVASNTDRVLTTTAAWSPGPDATTVYAIGAADRFSISSGTNTGTTLNDTTQAWQVNQWAGQRVVILSGTGAGQVRTIASNTATAITVSSAWTATPDTTSVFIIQYPEPVFMRLQDAINFGARSILLRRGGDTVTVTVASTDKVSNITGDDIQDSSLLAGITVNRTLTIMTNLFFDGQLLTMNAALVTVIDSLFRNVGARVSITGASSNDCGVVNCTFVNAGDASNPAITSISPNTRIIQNGFTGTGGLSVPGVIKLTGGTGQQVLGNVAIVVTGFSNLWTGWLIETSAPASGLAVTGNILTVPTTATGGILVDTLSQVQNNTITLPSVTTATTYTGIGTGNRNLVAGNLIQSANASSGTRIIHHIDLGIAPSGSALGNIVSNNVLVGQQSGGTGGHTGVFFSGTPGGNSIMNNFFIAVLHGATTTWVGIDPPLGGEDAFIIGNQFLGNNVANMPYPWQPISRTGSQTVFIANPNTPNIEVHQYNISDDFGGPLGPSWTRFAGSAGQVTTPDYVGGAIALATTATNNNDVGFAYTINLANVSAGGSFQYVFTLSAITAVDVVMGLMDKAEWVVNAGTPTNGLIFRFDTSVDANAHVYMKSGATTQDVNLGAPLVGVNKLVISLTRDLRLGVQFNGGLFGTGSASGAPSALLAPGFYIQTLTTAVKTLSVDLIAVNGQR